MPQSREYSLTTSTSWLMFAKTLGFVFTSAIPLVLVRQLPQADFGLYKQIFLVTGTAVTMLPLGVSMSAFYFLPRDPSRGRETVFNILLFTTVVGAAAWALLVLDPGLLVTLFKDPALAGYAPWIGLVIFLGVIGAFIEIVTVANQETMIATIFITVVQFSRAALFLTAALWARTIGALIAAAIVQGLAQIALLIAYLNSRFPRFWRA